MYNNHNFQSSYQQRPTYQQEQQNYQQQQTQQSMQIKNPQTGQLPKAKGTEMNDRDRLNDMLATEKYLTDCYNVFARETSYAALHQDVQRILSETHQETRNLFNFMFNRGWYSLQAESTQQIAQVQQQFTNYRTQFVQFPHMTGAKFESQPYQQQMF